MASRSKNLPSSNVSAYGREGQAGNVEAVYQMARLVRLAAADRPFAAFVNESFPTEVPADVPHLFDKIYNWVVASVKPVRDNGRVESIRSPQQTISCGFGEIDDLAVLIAALLAIKGFRPRFVLGFKKNTIAHIYVDVIVGKARFVFDPIFPANRPQFNRENEFDSTATLDVFDDKNLNSIYGVFKQTLLSAKDAWHSAADALFFGSNFLPLPAWGGLHLGATIAESALTQEDTLAEIASDIHKHLDSIIHQLQKKEIAFRVAKLQGLQSASRLNVQTPADRGDYEIIRATIERKLDWIHNYTQTEDEIQLHPKTMLGLGAIFVSGALAYAFLRSK